MPSQYKHLHKELQCEANDCYTKAVATLQLIHFSKIQENKNNKTFYSYGFILIYHNS